MAIAARRHWYGDLGTVTVAGYWRRYRLLVPTAITGETVLRWSTEPYIALSDVRELGIALSGVKQWPLERPDYRLGRFAAMGVDGRRCVAVARIVA